MGLLARLAALATEHGVGGEAALETPMGCGYGACLGCAVPHVDGRYALCCKDGPVFRFDEVVW
jgi:dihydroorotate dehydrogenase electron transfer subunit